MTRLATVCFVVLTALSLPQTLATAQEKTAQEKKGKGPAFTAPPKNDLNYALMGEFVGPISTGENEYESLALQLRPLGNDNFQAISFMGGLPGQEKHKPEMTQMIGRRSGEFLVLSGGPWVIIVEKDHCKLIGRDGASLGRLERVSRTSPTMGAQPPEGAVLLFDGTNIDQFTKAQMTKDGLLMQGAFIKPMFQDFNLHVEFRLPYMPEADGQQRGNSGLYLQGRYECQVLDSFGTERMINGCGALYKLKKPDLNMCFPPLVWQTYDVRFTAPRWAADGTKVRNAHITSWINGVKIHDNVSLPNKTGAGKQEEPLLTPSLIQDHGDPVRFRNIWVIDRGLHNVKEFPVLSPKNPPKTESKKNPAAKKDSGEKSDDKKEVSDADEKEVATESDAPKAKADAKKDESSKPKKKGNAKNRDKTKEQDA